MHDAAMRFVHDMVAEHDLNRDGSTVVEIGSFDVNGSVRPLFDAAELYVGVDVRPGPGVDVVADGAEFVPTDAEGTPLPVDVVVTTECLEHSLHWRRILTNAVKMLAPGGALLVTAAAPERTPHGIDGGSVGGEDYTNISVAELEAHLTRVVPEGSTVEVVHNAYDGDVYAFIRTKAKRGRGGGAA